MASPFNYKNTDKDPGIKTERLDEVVVTGKTKQEPIKNEFLSGKYPKFERRIQKPNIPTVTVPKYKKSYKPLWNPKTKTKTKQLLPQTRTIQRYSPKEQIMIPASKTEALRERPMTLPKFKGAEPLSSSRSNIYSSYQEQRKNLKNQ